MVNKIDIKQYRKLKNLELDFTSGINVISGSNGTCKTSLLHIISNSFKKLTKTNKNLINENSISVINDINDVLNPKIESLTKGDSEYNDPALGIKGTLFSITYFNGTSLDFRRHNSRNGGKNRFSIKPTYPKGSSQRLPEMPVIYLGLSRLFAYGEYQNDEGIKKINKKLPEKYLEEINKIYECFTGIKISYKGQEKMGDIKTRAEFSSQYKGVDSNTISAGEDNLFIIITALVSLKYYHDNISSHNIDMNDSILLIDEIDATLHPAYQIKLLNIMEEFAKNYKIQIIFTTHSLTLIEEALNKKNNVLYLIDNIDSVDLVQDVDIYKIKMFLKSTLQKDIYINRNIPIFTEDDEARLFLKCIFDYFEREYKMEFFGVKNLFHLVNANISSDSLCNIFKDSNLLRSTMRSICILDGDRGPDYTNYIIALPGNKAPEEVVFNQCKKIYEDSNNEFWYNPNIQGMGYTKVYYRDNIKPEIEQISTKIEEFKNAGKSTKGIRREENKKLFRKYEQFFTLVIKNWINSEENKQQLESFYNDLKTMFKKVSEFHEISSKEWKD
ncbi:AAA family ATPase [Clostridium sp.]|uniref:AAA family ATPase n=1 Tax=Clostridium sp. TaxID=1506 RepID=UPI0026167E5F|nr:AAA family ATPase [Clostridium sp.]